MTGEREKAETADQGTMTDEVEAAARSVSVAAPPAWPSRQPRQSLGRLDYSRYGIHALPFNS